MEGTELTSPRRYRGTELYLLEESKTWLCACVSLCPVATPRLCLPVLSRAAYEISH
jgi:hypothetical protein